ncbi:MAPEG family protein [Epibacterium ulvae]|uniref:Uncharacterized conserved protein, MAPEG superfamily n=1 Tax=Epibacterium ulvae TaxID=1156985 RepID=A0A1G5R9R5_9RHOB|nr:MAPEG family protein [Epibacterium ulvae]SCZ70787.1 Uncharacterized conserved protein, MAPEG superfamily [Epibacterium ulvae]
MSEIHWMAATGLMTALFWLVYVLNRFAVVGIPATLGNPSADAPPLSDWAQRAVAAHNNAIENFVIFAALALGVVALELSSALTVSMAMLYFFARLAHFVVYVMGIPVARTLAFAAGWAAQIVLALVILGVL